MKRCPECKEEYKETTRFCPRDGFNLDTVSAEPSAPLSTDPMLGRTLAGRYLLLEKLGQGGMGAVYKGQHVKMNRLTAIKVLTTDLANNPQFVARFEREAELASHIDHPNAVGIYDFGEAEDGLVYIAMEFIEGKALSKVIEEEGALALHRVVRITRQAAEALEAAHNLGIIHRDFKPDNIMVCQKSGRPDWVEVVDFGIAKRAAEDPTKQSLTQVGYVLGTPQYMSPEQVAGEPLDQRSDLYSLALVSYEMISGLLPFTGNTPQTVMVSRLLQPPLSLRQVKPNLGVSPAVEAVIMRALARNPGDRYSSTVEFATELERAVQGNQPTQQQPLGQPPRPVSTPYPPPPQQQAGPRPGSQQMPYPGPGSQQRPGSQQMPYPTPPQQQRPNTYPNQPHAPTPVSTPQVPTPYQPMQPYQQAPTHMQPPYPQQPYYPSGPYQQPKKSKAGLIVLIIVLVLLLLMGSCFMLAIIGSQSRDNRTDELQPQLCRSVSSPALSLVSVIEKPGMKNFCQNL
jgi:eukaryotic-like serine/threonine-protein kinase